MRGGRDSPRNLESLISRDPITIQTTPPLITSNKAREKYGLRLTGADGRSALRRLRAQRLAVAVTIYVEQFTAHPLERDAPSYMSARRISDSAGTFHKEPQSPDDTPVYEVTLRPEDGVYPLPYMARQADGQAWEDDGAHAMAPEAKVRQPFYPDGSRLFEEIDRLGIGDKGIGSQISARAEIDFYRIAPSSGYKKGLAAKLRTDVGEGDIAPGARARFLSVSGRITSARARRGRAGRMVNAVQRVLASESTPARSGRRAARASKRQCTGSTLPSTPRCRSAATPRSGPHGSSATTATRHRRLRRLHPLPGVGGRAGRNRAGVEAVQEQQVFAARDVQRPMRARRLTWRRRARAASSAPWAGTGPPSHLPARHATHACSDVNVTRLPGDVSGLSRAARPRAHQERAGRPARLGDSEGYLVKDGNYTDRRLPTIPRARSTPRADRTQPPRIPCRVRRGRSSRRTVA